MFEVIKRWFHTYFSEPQAVILLFLLVGSFLIIATMGKILMPVFFALGFSYLLNGVVNRLEALKFPRWLAVVIVLILFVTLVGLIGIHFFKFKGFARFVEQNTSKVRCNIEHKTMKRRNS